MCVLMQVRGGGVCSAPLRTRPASRGVHLQKAGKQVQLWDWDLVEHTAWQCGRPALWLPPIISPYPGSNVEQAVKQ